MTLRRRVLAYVGLAAAASCALTVAVAVVLVRHRVSAQRMNALTAQADAAALGDARAGTLVFRLVNGRPRRIVRPARVSAVLGAVPSSNFGDGSATVAGRGVLYAIRPSALGRAVVIRPAAIAFSEWRPFLASLALAGAGGLVLAGVLSLLLARRLTRPVAALVSATHRLRAGEAEVTVPARGADELADLGRSFNVMSAELARAQAAQRRFLESVSHELRTPLTSIRGYAEALEEGAVSAPEAARVISAEAGRLGRLVQDLLDLARAGRDDFSVSPIEVDLAAVCARAIERHAPAAAQCGVALRRSGQAPAPALGDEDRVLQVVSNLIENALRVTPTGGTIEVQHAPGEISVSDDGPGLASEDLPHAFERFYLYDRYRGERPVGTGLGLAIVHELVRSMGGQVDAREHDGRGAQFVVRLPASAVKRVAEPSERF